MNAPVGETLQEDGLSASVQVLPLPPGLYLFAVKACDAFSEPGTGKLNLPAMHVGLGPGVRSEQVEFISGPGTDGAWLFAHGDVLVAKVNGAGATLILTSVRASNGAVLSIEVERLEARSLASAPAQPEAAAAASTAATASTAVDAKPSTAHAGEGVAVPLKVTAHVRTRGDMTFVSAPWAGRIAPGLWIESFSVQPLGQLAPKDIEYKGLTGTGFETPWISGDANCGTKGISVPLMGFAIRLKPGSDSSAFDCEYSGYFQSGATVGPLRNGAPCRSTVANDPLEGIQIRIVRRAKTAAAAGKVEAAPQDPKAPSFGRFRDSVEAPPDNVATPAAATAAKSGKKTKSAESASKVSRSLRPARAAPTRVS